MIKELFFFGNYSIFVNSPRASHTTASALVCRGGSNVYSVATAFSIFADTRASVMLFLCGYYHFGGSLLTYLAEPWPVKSSDLIL